MNQEEAKQIFNETICGHWENWPRTAEELYVWVKALGPYDYTIARDAINELYAEWKGERYPKMPAIMGAIRKAAAQKQQASPLVKRYQIENEDGKPVWRPFWAKASVARQELEPEAKRLCKEADRMFPGQRHIARWFNPEGLEDKGYYGPDAKDRAFQEILEGPDCPTKTWLQAYLERKVNKRQAGGARAQAIEAKKRQEPVAIGAVLDGIPF